MRLSDFKYPISEKLIAQAPLKERDKARLMVLDRETKSTREILFREIDQLLEPGDCLVFNDTKVFPARLKGHKDKTDAEIEVFLLRELNNNLWEIMVKPARKVRMGNTITIEGGIQCEIIDNTTSGGRVVRFHYDGDLYKVIEKYGKTPLPPYIKREPDNNDKKYYQTIFANKVGAVAAPTAGLHFTNRLMNKLEKKGIKTAFLTLHVGLGTFRPVTVEDLSRHRMDSEYYQVTQTAADTINETIAAGKRIIAVGTTVTRTLESVATFSNKIKETEGWTDKFIYPPYKFKIVDGLITNFHLPGSTLLMLVSAFYERDAIMKAYRRAKRDKYRFFSYGDAMAII
jgi:S-adenosylmethionine:tRNA ribosyltransferase-isomerase